MSLFFSCLDRCNLLRIVSRYAFRTNGCPGPYISLVLRIIKLLVYNWPKACNRNFPAGKEFRNGKGISISQGGYLWDRFSAVGIFPQFAGAVDADGMCIRINENAYLDTLT